LLYPAACLNREFLVKNCHWIDFDRTAFPSTPPPDCLTFPL
jgi:hypothetical protein